MKYMIISANKELFGFRNYGKHSLEFKKGEASTDSKATAEFYVKLGYSCPELQKKEPAKKEESFDPAHNEDNEQQQVEKKDKSKK